MKTNIEICIDSCSGIDAAVEGGADRIELCSSLECCGLTPSLEVLKHASECGIQVRSMIRPRKGDFVYSSEELKKMLSDIDMARSFNIEGVVFGAILSNGSLDQDLLEELISYSVGLKKTLHRVVDTMAKTQDSVQTGTELGFDTILSSGGKNTALEGLSVLTEMHKLASGKINIMPGSGVNSKNVKQVLKYCHFDWVHSSCSIEKNGYKLTDVQLIKDLKNAIN